METSGPRKMTNTITGAAFQAFCACEARPFWSLAEGAGMCLNRWRRFRHAAPHAARHRLQLGLQTSKQCPPDIA